MKNRTYMIKSESGIDYTVTVKGVSNNTFDVMVNGKERTVVVQNTPVEDENSESVSENTEIPVKAPVTEEVVSEDTESDASTEVVEEISEEDTQSELEFVEDESDSEEN